MKNSFDDKVICVTGASSGIGEALLRELAHFRCTVFILSRSLDKLKELKKLLEISDMRIFPIQLDLADSASIKRAFAELTSQTDRLDVLINNAGVSQRGTALETDYAVLEAIMKVNFMGTIQWTNCCANLLKKSDSSQIAVVSSMAGEFTIPKRSSYAASKHALSAYFKTMQLEGNSPAVTIISPGGVKTNMSKNALKENGEVHGMMDRLQENGLSTEYVAKKILKAIQQKKKHLYLGTKETALLYISRWSPPLYRFIARKVNT